MSIRPRTIVARLDSDGDVLLAGPAIRAVAASGRDVTLWCGPRGAAAGALLPGVDRRVVSRAEWIDPEPPAVDRARLDDVVDQLAAEDADEAIVLTSLHQSALPAALLLRMAGVARIAGISEDYPGSLLDVRHRIDGEPHEVERALSVVATLGHCLPPDDDGALRVRRAPGGPRPPRPYVVVHPGASVPARAWAPARHRELVAALTARGTRVLVTGGPGERGLTSRVAEAGGALATDFGGRTTLPQLAEVLAAAEAVVVGNTGPAHLAAAVRTPVVSLFALPVPAARWRPYGVRSVLLSRDVPCAGCRARTCPVVGHPCIDEIGVDEVLAALARVGARSGGVAARVPG